MPLWGNVDTQGAKPKFPVERLVEAKQAAVVASQTSNTRTLSLNSATAILSAQVGLNANIAGNNIVAGTRIASFDVANGTITLSANTTANVIVGDIVTVGNNIVYHTNTYETTMNADTILATPTRLANTLVGHAAHAGWNHVRKKVNNDGTIRYISEVMVAMSNVVASNTSSGNTSNTSVFSGI